MKKRIILLAVTLVVIIGSALIIRKCDKDRKIEAIKKEIERLEQEHDSIVRDGEMKEFIYKEFN